MLKFFNTPERYIIELIFKTLSIGYFCLYIVNIMHWPITCVATAFYILYNGSIMSYKAISINNKIQSFGFFLYSSIISIPLARIIILNNIDIKIPIIILGIIAAYIRNNYQVYAYASISSFLLFLAHVCGFFVDQNNLIHTMIITTFAGISYMYWINYLLQPDKKTLYKQGEENNKIFYTKLKQIINVDTSTRESVIQVKKDLSKIHDKWKDKWLYIFNKGIILLISEQDFNEWEIFYTNQYKMINYIKKAYFAYLCTKQIQISDQQRILDLQAAQLQLKDIINITIEGIEKKDTAVIDKIDNIINNIDLLKNIEKRLEANIIYEFILYIESAAFLSTKY